MDACWAHHEPLSCCTASRQPAHSAPTRLGGIKVGGRLGAALPRRHRLAALFGHVQRRVVADLAQAGQHRQRLRGGQGSGRHSRNSGWGAASARPRQKTVRPGGGQPRQAWTEAAQQRPTWSPKSAPVGDSRRRTLEEPSTPLYARSCASVGLRGGGQRGRRARVMGQRVGGLGRVWRAAGAGGKWSDKRCQIAPMPPPPPQPHSIPAATSPTPPPAEHHVVGQGRQVARIDLARAAQHKLVHAPRQLAAPGH